MGSPTQAEVDEAIAAVSEPSDDDVDPTVPTEESTQRAVDDAITALEDGTSRGHADDISIEQD